MAEEHREVWWPVTSVSGAYGAGPVCPGKYPGIAVDSPSSPCFQRCSPGISGAYLWKQGSRGSLLAVACLWQSLETPEIAKDASLEAGNMSPIVLENQRVGRQVIHAWPK